MTSPALSRFVGHVLERHGAELESTFPRCFDWQGLCADTPQLTARASRGRYEAGHPAQDRALAVRADAVFRFAHLGTLAALSLTCCGGEDPAHALGPFLQAPEDEGEARFEVLVRDLLGPIEESLEGARVALDERGGAALALLGAAWPLAQSLLRESGLLGEESPPGSELPAALARPVLAGTARMAAILAALRWMAAGRAVPSG